MRGQAVGALRAAGARRTATGARRRLRPGDVVVAAQLTALAGLAWPGRGRWRIPRVVRTGALAAMTGGGVVSAAGLGTLGREATIWVEPQDGARLRTSGAYALSRNPVYTGLLVGAAGFAVLRRRREPLVAFAALAGVLHLKASLEERRLSARFGAEYDDYARRVPRLIGLPRRAAR